MKNTVQESCIIYASKIYVIHANPDHVHFLVSRDSAISDEKHATIIVDSSENLLFKINWKWKIYLAAIGFCIFSFKIYKLILSR